MPEPAARPIRVLFLCTGNSARSVIAEACLNALGAPRFNAASAGSHPAGRVHPGALAVLRRNGIDTNGLRSKSWDEFSAGDRIDIVITVCAAAAGETCPVFPGRAVRAHWGVADPPAADDVDAAFERAYAVIRRRIERLVGMPPAAFDGDDLPRRLQAIADEIPEAS